MATPHLTAAGMGPSLVELLVSGLVSPIAGGEWLSVCFECRQSPGPQSLSPTPHEDRTCSVDP